jgi:16S rRNA (cytidine1402-2'-O)-methyltransferase
MNDKPLLPGLYIVATPIGNLGDITLRGLATLKQVDLIACEDTRVTGKLLHQFGVKTRMTSYHEHNARQKQEEIMEVLRGGGTVALTSDAGTPLISDPGYHLVKDVAQAAIAVYPVPGACAAIAALSVSGLPTDAFVFVGFLPTQKSERDARLAPFTHLPATLVFYESANRIADTLAYLVGKLGAREAVVAREITKLHETIYRGTLADLSQWFGKNDVKGEIVLMVGAPLKQEVEEIPLDDALLAALEKMSVKDAAAFVAEQTGRSRKEVYKRAIELQPKRKSG